MKRLLLILVIFLAGCDSEIGSHYITVGQTLCSDQEGIRLIEIDPISDDLYVCNDGSQFVVGYGTINDESVYYIRYNTKNQEMNEAVDRILQPKKWAKKEKRNE